MLPAFTRGSVVVFFSAREGAFHYLSAQRGREKKAEGSDKPLGVVDHTAYWMNGAVVQRHLVLHHQRTDVFKRGGGNS